MIWNSEHENYDKSIGAADQFFAVSPSNAKIIGVPPLLRTESALFLFVHSQACGIDHLGELVDEVFDTAVLDVGFDSGSDRVFHRSGVAGEAMTARKGHKLLSSR